MIVFKEFKFLTIFLIVLLKFCDENVGATIQQIYYRPLQKPRVAKFHGNVSYLQDKKENLRKVTTTIGTFPVRTRQLNNCNLCKMQNHKTVNSFKNTKSYIPQIYWPPVIPKVPHNIHTLNHNAKTTSLISPGTIRITSASSPNNIQTTLHAQVSNSNMKSHTSTLNILSGYNIPSAYNITKHTKYESQNSHVFKDNTFIYNSGKNNVKIQYPLNHNIVHINTQAHQGYVKTNYVGKSIISQKGFDNPKHFHMAHNGKTSSPKTIQTLLHTQMSNTNMKSTTSTMHLQSGYNIQKTHFKTHTVYGSNTSVLPFHDQTFKYNSNGGSYIHHQSSNHNYLHIYTKSHQYDTSIGNSKTGTANSNHFNTNTNSSKTNFNNVTPNSNPITVTTYRPEIGSNINTAERNVTEQAKEIVKNLVNDSEKNKEKSNTNIRTHTNTTTIGNETNLTHNTTTDDISHNDSEKKRGKTFKSNNGTKKETKIFHNKNLTNIISEQARKILENVNDINKSEVKTTTLKPNANNDTETKKYGTTLKIFNDKNLTNIISEQARKILENVNDINNSEVKTTTLKPNANNDTETKKNETTLKIFQNKNLTNIISEQARKISENVNDINKSEVKSTTIKPNANNDTETKKYGTTLKIFNNKNLTNIISEQARKISENVNDINNNEVKSTTTKPNIVKDTETKKKGTTFKIFKNKNLTNIISEQARKIMHTTTENPFLWENDVDLAR